MTPMQRLYLVDPALIGEADIDHCGTVQEEQFYRIGPSQPIVGRARIYAFKAAYDPRQAQSNAFGNTHTIVPKSQIWSSTMTGRK